MALSIKNICIYITTCLMLASCSGTRHLPPGEKLYTGAVIKLETTAKLSHKKKKSIKASAENVLRPKPNKKILGMRPKLWMYMSAGENPKSKLQKWLKKKGEEPVLMSSIKPAVSSQIIDARLFNIGIFDSYTEYKIVENQHTAKVIYTSHIQTPFVVKELIYAVSDEQINRIIIAGKKNSLIKPGDEYSLENLKNERIRIDALLKDSGYYYFNPDFLLFKADTSILNNDVTFKLTIKDSITEKARSVYRIHNVFIYQDYSLNDSEADRPKDSIYFQGIYFSGTEAEMKIKPKVIARSVYLRRNEIYSRKNHNITLNRLMTMGNFKFVQMKFADSDTAAGYLDVTILMTPMPEHSFRAEMDIVTKSNNYTGPRLNTSFLNRNTFRGAELLNLSLAGSYEAQLSGKNKNLYSYSLNPQAELYFPRFIVPFKIKRNNSLYVPKTRFSVSYTYLRKVGYFDMRTFQFVYGYKWKGNITNEHELNPINLSYTTLANRSDTFNILLESNPFLKKSYEEQFIAGGSYTFTYNEQVISLKKIQYFLQFSTELAGNVFSLAKTISGQKISSDKPVSMVGSVYSQFTRTSIDGRTFFNFIDKNKLALRLYAGVARAYGNSSTLPYIKQFFGGGPSSIRAFRINSIGPGTYNQNNDSIGFLQLGGDVKLEMNAEYRFGIYRFFKGALFIDAGNVWRLSSNPSTTGGAFSFSRFASELAVGAGVGLRVDVSFFVLRFDLATPLRKPWLEPSNRWVLNQIDFGSPSWRSNNLILNVAIGYPF